MTRGAAESLVVGSSFFHGSLATGEKDSRSPNTGELQGLEKRQCCQLGDFK